MRLLSVDSLQLEQFNDEDAYPRYAILSHTWGEEEVMLPDLQRENVFQMKGYLKIQKSCERARMDGLGYIWIDTCCIDKSSSAELSEAINSMFKWYERSTRCYAYLEDVRKPRDFMSDAENRGDLSSRLKQSRYWTRGWTLQELIAPREVWVYDRSWEFIGTRRDLSSEITEITAIDRDVLSGSNSAHWSLQTKSVAKRMSWAATRKTTRKEDLAYCLLGIFDINMPLLYGEGIKKAFCRLQDEILRTSTDQTILAWSTKSFDEIGVLAPHPICFAPFGNLVRVPDLERASKLTSSGLKIKVRLLERWKDYYAVAIIACSDQDEYSNLRAIPIYRPDNSTSFQRSFLTPLVSVPTAIINASNPPFQTIYLLNRPKFSPDLLPPSHILLTGWPKGARITTYPADRWNPFSRTMHLRDIEKSQLSCAFIITMMYGSSSKAITFGLAAHVMDSPVAYIRLFSEPASPRPDPDDDTWLGEMVRYIARRTSVASSDGMGVGGMYLSVRIEFQSIMGRRVFVIEPMKTHTSENTYPRDQDFAGGPQAREPSSSNVHGILGKIFSRA